MSADAPDDPPVDRAPKRRSHPTEGARLAAAVSPILGAPDAAHGPTAAPDPVMIGADNGAETATPPPAMAQRAPVAVADARANAATPKPDLPPAPTVTQTDTPTAAPGSPVQAATAKPPVQPPQAAAQPEPVAVAEARATTAEVSQQDAVTGRAKAPGKAVAAKQPVQPPPAAAQRAPAKVADARAKAATPKPDLSPAPTVAQLDTPTTAPGAPVKAASPKQPVQPPPAAAQRAAAMVADARAATPKSDLPAPTVTRQDTPTAAPGAPVKAATAKPAVQPPPTAAQRDPATGADARAKAAAPTVPPAPTVTQPPATAPHLPVTFPADRRAEAATPERRIPPPPAATPRDPLTVAADARAKSGQPEPAGEPPTAAAQISSVDIEQFSKNVARMVEEGGKALAAYLKPREEGKIANETGEDVADVVRTLGQVAEYWLADPKRTMEIQHSLGTAYLDLWASTMRRLAGEDAAPVALADPRDRRFADPEWSSNQFFDFLKQAYLLGAQWADRLVRNAQGLDAHTRQKAEFYVRQIANAVSPSNFVLTNPELWRATLSSSGENLVRGMQMLTEDIQAGHGHLKIRQSDASQFEVGRNLALSPGKVIYQNDLMQLIQYAPSTETVLRRPLLIVPPWINKFYILDLTPEKSFIKYCVDQGLTVFVISWVNPDEHLARKSFEDYMRDGPLTALDIVGEVTGEDKVHAIGYCVGGTLLSVTLAYMAAKGDGRIISATLFAAQTDFTYAGDLKVFVDEERIQSLERQMTELGYLEGQRMATAFNLLRSNDLIWPYVINNYLKGQAPFPFDLLFWNADATQMPAANHSFYMRNCYLENKLSRGEMVVAGETLDLGKVTIPIYNLATREDHIAPAKSAFLGSKFFGGEVRFVLAGSGHIAGVINPPYKVKYQYWTGGPPTANIDTWIARAQEHPGSWWPDWIRWIEAQDGERVPARQPGGGKRQPIEDAPGSYVRKQI